jgi:DNA-binding IclR family transcriptional regulator
MPEDKLREAPIEESLDRGLVILQAVALSKEPVSVGELNEMLRISHSTVFRLASTLRRRGFLACPAGRKDYILGSSMWRLSHRYDWGNMLLRVVGNQLELLAVRVDETAHLAIREGKSALFIDYAAGSNLIAVAGQVGKLVPLHCTAHGKALLADGDEGELSALFGSDQLHRYTKNTMTSIKELSKDCALIKKRGFATDDAEYAEDLRCVSAPIRANNLIFGSIGVSAPKARFSKESRRVAAEYACELAEEIGLLLDNANRSAWEPPRAR